MIPVSVNGEPKQLAHELNIVQLLDVLQLAGKKVAVERNGEIVPRSRYADTRVGAGDQLEIVGAVGGG